MRPAKPAALKFQADFFLLLADLLQAGFSLAQSLLFISILLPKEAQRLDRLIDHLAAGGRLASGLAEIGIQSDIVNQMLITEQHGDLTKSLSQTGHLLSERLRQQQKLRQLLRYPVLLLVILVGLIGAVKVWLTPEIQSWQLALNRDVLRYWQALGLILAVISVSLGGLIWRSWHTQNPLQRAQRFCQLPLIGKSCRYYYHYYLLTNLGTLLANGLHLDEICRFLLELSPTSLLHAIGQELQPALQAGQPPRVLIQQINLLPPELDLFVQRGQTPTLLGRALVMQAQLTYRKLLVSLGRLATYLQPILLLLVALVIIGVYLSILLPLYQMMEGMY